MYNTHKNNAVINLTSSRSVGMRDINTLLTAPISRIKTLRDDEGRTATGNVGQVGPDDKKHLIENNSCVAVPVLQPYGTGSEQQHLRTSALLNSINPSPALTGSLSLKGRGKRTCGFTLIELLVVVLIIGILAAIALPQYQKAVEKARVAQVVAAMRSLQQAEEVYYLTNGNYTSNINDLDISLSAMPTGWELALMQGGKYLVEAQRRKIGVSIGAYFNHPKSARSGRLICWSNNAYPFAYKICQSISRKKLDNAGGGQRWLL